MWVCLQLGGYKTWNTYAEKYVVCLQEIIRFGCTPWEAFQSQQYGFVSSFNSARLLQEPHPWLLQYPLTHRVESVPVISAAQGRRSELEVNEEDRSQLPQLETSGALHRLISPGRKQGIAEGFPWWASKQARTTRCMSDHFSRVQEARGYPL